MFCPKCGTQLEAFEVFCHSCGHRMTEEPHTSSQEPAPAEQAAPLVETPVQPKKKSKKKLIIGITAAVTALAVGIGAVAFYLVRNPKVYLRTKITEYDKNGDWARTVEYQYNDQGSRTEITITSPDYDEEEVWNEDLGLSIYQSIPNEGERVYTYTYEYNDEGHCVSYEYLYERFDKNGKQLEETVYDSTVKCDYRYNYNDDGTIDTIDQRTLTMDGSLGEYEWETVYHYDDDGRLHEISNQRNDGEYSKPMADFRYDKKGRLTVSSYRRAGIMSLYHYEYNRSGQLENMSFTWAPSDAPFDDEHITGIKKDEWPGAVGEPTYEAEFEYDSKGRLTSREVFDAIENTKSKVELEYDGKFISRIEYENYEVQITDDEDEADSIADKLDENDVVMVRDKHGNIIKAIAADGAYIEYEYEAVRLPKKLVVQHKSIMFAIRSIDLIGRQGDNMVRYGGGNGLWSYVEFPTNELYEIEVLLNARF